jgi:hypothetical protein
VQTTINKVHYTATQFIQQRERRVQHLNCLNRMVVSILYANPFAMLYNNLEFYK